MARASATAAPTAVTVKYDLFDLPTAQHKAGLAGLILQIHHMEGKSPKPKAIPRIVELTRTSATIEFTAESMQCLFDDVYMAAVNEEWFRNKKDKEHLKGERTRDVGGSNVKEYLYDATRPTFPALRQLLGDGAGGAAWLKLWQDMVWGVPRGVNTTRIPFEVVAGWDRKKPKDQRRTAPKSYPEGDSVWKDIVKFCSARDTGSPPQVSQLDGKLWIGAQKETAEQVKFQGWVNHNLLLHFWTNAVFVSVPQSLKAERKAGKLVAKRRADGFALAIPDIADLKDFLSRYRVILSQMGKEEVGERFRPPSAAIELAAQGALSLVDRDLAAGIIVEQVTGKEIEYSISGVDYIHLRPTKNGPKMASSGRLSLREGIAKEYRNIVGRVGEKPPYKNPLFRRGLLLALLNNQPWYQPFGKLFAEWDVSFFVPTDAPPKLSWFWLDARKKLQEVILAMPTDPKPDDPPLDENDILSAAINRFIQRYLDERIKKDKSEWDFAKFRKEKNTPLEAAEARRKLAERLFLELRSRRDQAFIDHFTNTFFSVPQYLGPRPAPRMFERIANALMTKTENVKTLTLMALSSNGWVPTTKKEASK